MSKFDLFELYEKLYFHELEIKEKITTRVQLVFTLMVMLYTVASYMLRMLDYSSAVGVVVLFLLFFGAFGVFSALAIPQLIRAFWGNVFQCIPSPCETEKYRAEVEGYCKDIISFNKENPDNKQPEIDVSVEVKDYLYEKYKDCAAHNTVVNERRSVFVHEAFKWLIISAVPLLVAALLFIVIDLDVSSPRKEFSIRDKDVALELSRLNLAVDRLSRSVTANGEAGNMTNEKSEKKEKNDPPVKPNRPASRAVLEDTSPPKKL
ncbi:hypothetical protein [Stutzerimonas kunmingensis]|jgi:hypothetical protein|uniref:hypothetical protein n=1 Tax=Stutzerimonas kunmingensis TaxID=1211807 RepID=UPI0028B1B291|nr:hypothetical protein [Stutzerimonas kunmingensis]